MTEIRSMTIFIYFFQIRNDGSNKLPLSRTGDVRERGQAVPSHGAPGAFWTYA